LQTIIHIQGLKNKQDINDKVIKNINTCIDNVPIRMTTLDSLKLAEDPILMEHSSLKKFAPEIILSLTEIKESKLETSANNTAHNTINFNRTSGYPSPIYNNGSRNLPKDQYGCTKERNSPSCDVTEADKKTHKEMSVSVRRKLKEKTTMEIRKLPKTNIELEVPKW
jgi:hypothetical protein